MGIGVNLDEQIISYSSVTALKSEYCSIICNFCLKFRSVIKVEIYFNFSHNQFFHVQVGSQTALSIARRAKKLQSLDLSWCRDLTENALGHIVDNCPSLRLLKLFGCSQVYLLT